MEVVLTDDLGRQVRTSVPVRLTNGLLRAGLSARWAAAGLQRPSSDFSYGGPVVGYVQRWGVSDNLTASVQVGVSAGTQTFGVSASALLNARRFLVVDTSVNTSPAGWGLGGRLGLYERHPDWAFGVSAVWNNAAFVPAGASLPQLAGIGLNGTLSLLATPSSAVSADTSWFWPALGAPTGLLSLSYIQGLSGGTTLVLTGTVQHTGSTVAEPSNTRVTVGATVQLPLSANTNAALTVTPTALQVGVRGSTPDSTLAYGVQAGVRDQVSAGQASLQWRTPVAAFNLDAAVLNGQWTGVVRADGQVGVVDGVAFASGQSGGAVALVKVADFPGVRVQLNGLPMGRTDQHGQLVVSGLAPFATNRLSIDVADLPLQARVTATEVQVTPLPSNTVRAVFPVARVRSALLHLRRADGTPVPLGAVGTVMPGSSGGSDDVPIAEDGLVYVESVGAKVRLQVRWPSGSCEVQLALPTTDEPLPDLGSVPCLPNR